MITFDLRAALAYNRTHGAPSEEQLATMAALWQSEHGLLVDGKFGTTTAASVQAVVNGLLPQAVPITGSAFTWAAFDGPLNERPKTRADVRALFGNPGKGEVDEKWERANIVELHGKDAIPEIPAKYYFKCHRLVEAYMREAFRRAGISAPGYVIVKAASFVFRHMRHDEDMPLSYHSWGIGVDINSDDNKAKEFGPGKTPKPWSAEWYKHWPNCLPKAVVDAFVSCGFSWGGYWKGYVDPMHFEWVGQREVQV